jgi:Tfp pilus assembly protein PilF
MSFAAYRRAVRCDSLQSAYGSPTRRRAGWLTLAGVLVLLISACGSPQQSDAQKAGILLQSGLAAHQAGRTDEAAADYKKVLALDPKSKWAHYNLGVIEQGQGQNAAAEIDYRAVLAVDPNFSGALYNLALLRTTTAPQEAVDLYRRAIAVSPTMASAHLNLGFLLIALGQQPEGKVELNRAVALNPTFQGRVPAATHSPAAAPTKKP